MQTSCYHDCYNLQTLNTKVQSVVTK